MYYGVRIKGHFGQDWSEVHLNSYNDLSNSLQVQSSSQYTVISLPANYQVGDEVDIQVEAVLGYVVTVAIGHPPEPNVYTYSSTFFDATSCWGPTQTFTVPETATSASTNPLLSPAPTSTPAVPEFPTWIILPLFAIALLLSIVIRKKITKKYLLTIFENYI